MGGRFCLKAGDTSNTGNRLRCGVVGGRSKGSRSSGIRGSKLEGEEDFQSGLGEVEIREGLWLLVMARDQTESHGSEC